MRILIAAAGHEHARTIFAILAVICGFGVFAVPVFAAEGAVQWSVSSVSRPSGFAVGAAPGVDSFVVLVTNSGAVASSGTVTITDELPEGLAPAAGVTARDELAEAEDPGSGGFSGGCSATGSGGVACVYSGVVQPDDTLVLSVPVGVMVGVPGLVRNVVRVSGGGAPAAAVMETPTSIFPSEVAARAGVGFGIAPGGASTALSSVQAGGHPDLTTTFALDTENAAGATAGNLKNATDDLPAGFAGDLVDTPVCSAVAFLFEECPLAAQVGVTTVMLKTGEGAPTVLLEPVYNLAPEPGEVAKIGFWAATFHYEGDISVRTPGEPGAPAGQPGEPYGLKTTFYDATAGTVDVDNVALTVWGDPANPVHDRLRRQPKTPGQVNWHFGAASDVAEAAYFTNPTACGAGPLVASFQVTSWQEHEPDAPPAPAATLMPFGPIVGCDLSALWMEPQLTAEVTSDSAGAATGLDLATKIRQTYPDPGVLATSTLKREVVTLPEGMTVNPSAGAGLEACSAAEYAEEQGQFVAGRGCPAASKLATVRIKTPSIEEEVTGSVFLAQPYENPFGEPPVHPGGTLLAVYLIARASNRGVLIKSPGKVEPNLETGRLKTTFDGLPPLPFSLATFAFNQGANAPLVTPPACGNYTVTAELTPWSNPEGSPLTPEIPPFPITTGCPAGGTPPFNPQVTAYPIHANAGAYSPFYIRISRNDGEQEVTGFSSVLPEGLSANLGGVPFCSEGQIEAARGASGAQEEAEPSCPPGSEIGHTIAEAGVGTVLAQTPGRLYLAGGFQGAPFSIVSITSAKVGPFDLGTVVVHLPLLINPETAVVSIPEGAADQIPHIIKGIVIHLRNIRVYVDREKFMLNPTSCNPLLFSATVIGGGLEPRNPADNDPVTVTDPFQAADCSSLAFTPKLTVATAGHASKANGASLLFKVAYPKGALGTQSWFNEAKFDIPKQLPARLGTIQKACLAVTFEKDRQACPAASIIGHAVVHTQILPVPLEGPVYFVSYGSAKFPDAVTVLKGYGVTIELHGETFINKKSGVTSATFRQLPDVPFESIEVSVPTGPFSEFGANLPAKDNYNFCGHKLAMPTLFKASNGTEIHQNTPVAVTGCHKKKKAKPHKKTSHHHKKK